MVLTQYKVYAREMGSDSCGRLRFVVLHLDPGQVRSLPFEEKLVPRVASNELLTEVLREVLLAQQRAAISDSVDDRPYPPRIADSGSRALWRQMLASHFAPLAALIMREGEEQSQGEDRQGPRCSAVGKAQAAKRRPLKEEHAHLRKRPRAGEIGELQALMEVKAMEFNAAATLVLAAVNDGSGAACAGADDPEGTSIVAKHAGKAFGALATANVGQRNSLSRYVCGRGFPLDNRVRLMDCLAALPKMELFSVNQLACEEAIRAYGARARLPGRAASHTLDGDDGKDPVGPQKTPIHLEPHDFAARRFFEALAQHTSREVPSKGSHSE